MKSRILVLDANQRSALAVTRSLGRHSDLEVYTADTAPVALAGSSSFSSKYLTYTSPEQESGAFLSDIQNIVKNFGIHFIQPTTEITSQLLAQYRGQFPSVILPFPDLETIQSISDKSRLLDIATSLGIPVPNSRFFNTLSEWLDVDTSEFPLVLKPSKSRIYSKNKWITTAVRIVRNKQELDKWLSQDTYLKYHPFMIQEFIPGSGAGIFVLYDKGKLVSSFAHRRIREKPPSGGVSVLSESTAVDPTLLKYTVAILDKVKWSGVAMVEYRVTPEGTAWLMEINTRFWGSLQLAIDAGVDFPYMTYQLFTGQPVSIEDYNKGQRLRWFLGDVDNLYLYMKSPGISFRKKLAHLITFLKPINNCKNEILRFPDYKPAIFELKQYIKNLLK